ncbi:hypothetical protein PIB30_017836 [Stylosanthes scabra]|uniref:CCHC-type domain-containing protein n=1 Tax=Stylosanthes scabra TaxID=79078 RepID=A0ABU6W5T9_9FABA|nr:hypothetical protein [Stylosanthes scabra]
MSKESSARVSRQEEDFVHLSTRKVKTRDDVDLNRPSSDIEISNPCDDASPKFEKKIVPKIYILGSELYLEYEGLHQICFSCGKYGHRLEHCTEISNAPSHSHEDGSGARETVNPDIGGGQPPQPQNENNNYGIDSQQDHHTNQARSDFGL